MHLAVTQLTLASRLWINCIDISFLLCDSLMPPVSPDVINSHSLSQAVWPLVRLEQRSHLYKSALSRGTWKELLTRECTLKEVIKGVMVIIEFSYLWWFYNRCRCELVHGWFVLEELLTWSAPVLTLKPLDAWGVQNPAPIKIKSWLDHSRSLGQQ